MIGDGKNAVFLKIHISSNMQSWCFVIFVQGFIQGVIRPSCRAYNQSDRPWQSQYGNNLIIDRWECPCGCLPVSDKTSKKGLAGRKVGCERACSLTQSTVFWSVHRRLQLLSSPSVSMWQLDKQPVAWGGKILSCDVEETLNSFHRVVLRKLKPRSETGCHPLYHHCELY